MPAGRRGFKLFRLHRLFGAENDEVVVDSARAKLLSHDAGKGAAGGFGDVADPKQARVALVAGAEG